MAAVPIAAALIAFCLVLPIRLRIEATLSGASARVRAEAGFFFGVLRPSVRLLLRLEPGFEIGLYREKRGKLIPVKKKPKKKKRARLSPAPFVRALELRELRLRAVVGIEDDPAAAVLICGAAQGLMRYLAEAAPDLFSKRGRARTLVSAEPEFKKSTCSLALAGIIATNAAKLILIPVKLIAGSKRS